jgi:hypothetical protein
MDFVHIRGEGNMNQQNRNNNANSHKYFSLNVNCGPHTVADYSNVLILVLQLFGGFVGN